MSNQTFRIALLPDVGTRMTCSEAGCQAYAGGWVSVLDVSDPKHAEAATFIKMGSGRRFIEQRSEDALDYLINHRESLGIMMTPELRQLLERTPAGLAVFLFPAGQQCFKPHIDREVVFAHQTAMGTRVHSRPLDFNEHMNEEAYRVNRALQLG